MPFNKYPLVYQSAKAQEDLRDSSTSLIGSAARLATLAPFAYGAYRGFSSLKTNTGINILDLPSNKIADMASNVGQNIQQTHTAAEVLRADQGEKFARRLLESREIENILGGVVDRRNAFLAGVVETLDQRATVGEVQRQLLNALDLPEGQITDDVQKAVRAATETLKDMGEGDNLRKAIARFEGAGPLLPPTPFTDKQMGELFTKRKAFDTADELLQAVTSAGGNRARTEALITRISRAAGSDARVTYHGIMEAGQLSTFAKVAQREGRRSVNVNLTHATLQGAGGQAGMTSPIFRVGESAATTYVGKMLYLDVDKARALMSEGVTFNKTWHAQQVKLLETGKGGSAIQGLPEVGVTEFERHARGNFSRHMSQSNIRSFYEFEREMGEEISRAGRLATGARADDPFRMRLQHTAASKSSNILLTGLENAPDPGRFISQLVSQEGGIFTGLSQADIKRLEGGRAIGQVSFNLASNSPINAVRSDLTLGGDPTILPTTARPRQNIRESQFMPSNTGGKTIQGLSNSGLMRMWNQNLEYASSAMGGVQGVNTAYILDVAGEGRRWGLGEGMAYWGATGDEFAKPLIQHPFSKTINAPHDVLSPETPIFRELKTRHQQRVGPLTIGSEIVSGINKGKVIRSVEDMGRYFGVGKAGQLVLGFSDQTMVELPNYTKLRGFSFELAPDAGASIAMGRERFHISGSLSFGATGEKVHSTFAKAMTREMNEGTYDELLRRSGVAGVFERAGVQRGGVLVGSGAQVGKGPMHLAAQMISGAGLLAPSGAFKSMEDTYTRMLRGVSSASSKNFAGERQVAYLGSLVGNIAEELTKAWNVKGMSRAGQQSIAQEFGVVFGAAASHKKAAGTAFGFGQTEAIAAIRAGLERGGFGAADPFTEQVIKEASKGIAFGGGTLAAGVPTDIYRQTLGSMEPRTFAFLSHRLQNTLGLSQDQVSDFMTAFLARKGAMGSDISTLQGLTKMVNSMAPVGAPFSKDALDTMKVVSAGEFAEGAAGSPERAKKFLSQYKEGFLLDLGDPTGKVGGISRTTGGGHIQFPGEEAIKGMRGTEIRQSGGQKIRIEDEFFGRMTGFAEDISGISSRGYVTSQELREAQDLAGKAFKRDIANLWGQSWHGLLRGKLMGSGFLSGEGVLLGADASPHLNVKQLNQFRNVVSRTRGAAVFADAQGFIDVMSQFKGGVAAEHRHAGVAINRANRLATQETAERFERFFLGMERKHTQGLSAIPGRNPQLGPGHVSMAELYRYDVGDEVDDVFRRFSETAEGKAALKKLAKRAKVKQITSFQQIAGLKGGRVRRIRGKKIEDISVARKSLFRTFSETTSNFMGEGGGRLFFPDMETSVHYTSGHEHKINFSKAAMMIGDFDGDYYNLFMMSERQRGALASGDTKAVQVMRNSMIEDLMYNAQSQQFAEQSKESMQLIKKEMEAAMPGSMTATGFRAEEAMKEYYAKQIGQFDVALDKVRLGMIHSVKGPGEQRAAQRALAMLTPLEEIVIKAKKLPRALPVADQALGALRGLSEGDTGPFQRFIKEVMLKGRDRFGDIGRVDLPDYLQGTKTGNEIEAAVKRLAQQGDQGAFDIITKGALFAKENAVAIKTQMEAAGFATMDTLTKQAGFSSAVWNHQSIQGALSAGEGTMAMQQEFARIQARAGTVLKGLNKNLLGPLALGAAGAMALGAAVGKPGYSSTPMIMPGEISDYRVNAAIAAGNLQGQTGTGPQPNELATPAYMNSVQRPVNIGETYFSDRNAYSIRGNSSSLTSLNRMSNFVAGLGGSTSVRINDTRRPLTPNYIDRLMGD